MTTFSQLVDDMVSESRRADMILEICKYTNQTIRDVHFNDNNTNLLLFDDNRVEALVYANSDDSYVWPIPNPQTFAKLEAIYCPDVSDYAILRKPGQAHSGNRMGKPTYYRTGPALSIGGYGGNGSAIQIAYFAYPRNLVYYPTARKVTWSEENQTYSFDSSVTTPEQQEDALVKNVNWLLERWTDMIREGVRAKLYKKLNDADRMRSAYSAFESARKGMLAAETYGSDIIVSE